MFRSSSCPFVVFCEGNPRLHCHLLHGQFRCVCCLGHLVDYSVGFFLVFESYPKAFIQLQSGWRSAQKGHVSYHWVLLPMTNLINSCRKEAMDEKTRLDVEWKHLFPSQTVFSYCFGRGIKVIRSQCYWRHGLLGWSDSHGSWHYRNYGCFPSLPSNWGLWQELGMFCWHRVLFGSSTKSPPSN